MAATKFVGFFLIAVLCGIAQAHVMGHISKRSIASQEKDALDHIQEVTIQVRQLSREIAKVVSETISVNRKYYQKAITIYREHFSRYTGMLEDQIEYLTSINIAKETCDIIGLRSKALMIFDLGQLCTNKLLNETAADAESIILNLGKFPDQVVVLEQELKQCKIINGYSDEAITQCLKDSKDKSDDILKTLKNFAVSSAKMYKMVHFPVVVEKCFVIEGSHASMRRSEKILNCIAEKVPAFKPIADEINNIAHLIDDNVIKTLHKAREYVFKYYRTLYSPIAKLGTQVFGPKFQEYYNKVFDFIELHIG